MESPQILLQSQKASDSRLTFEELNYKIDAITQFASKSYFNKALKKLAEDNIENQSA